MSNISVVVVFFFFLNTTQPVSGLVVSQVSCPFRVKPNKKKARRKINKVHVLPGLLWKGLSADGRMPAVGWVWLQWDKEFSQP